VPRAPFLVGRWRRHAGACAREEPWRWRRWSDDVQGNGVQGGDVQHMAVSSLDELRP
jgi:hypothetical protein